MSTPATAPAPAAPVPPAAAATRAKLLLVSVATVVALGVALSLGVALPLRRASRPGELSPSPSPPGAPPRPPAAVAGSRAPPVASPSGSAAPSSPPPPPPPRVTVAFSPRVDPSPGSEELFASPEPSAPALPTSFPTGPPAPGLPDPSHDDAFPDASSELSESPEPSLEVGGPEESPAESPDASPVKPPLQAEHIAHAVPGRAYVVFDLDGDGIEIVQLDASRSHSHFYDPGPPPRLGEIVSWVWIDPPTGNVLSEASTPFLTFPVGVTEIILRVEDNFGNTNEDSTTVTVNPSTREGVFCYYYDEVAPDGFSISVENNIVNGLKPVFGEELPAIDFRSVDSFPAQVASGPFQTRCTFSLQTTQPGPVTFRLAHYGPMRMLREVPGGHEVVMEDYSWGNSTTSTEYDLPAGINALQIIYVRLDAAPAFLRLIEAPGPRLHNLATQLPLIYSLSPPNSTLVGGGRMTVRGSGLWSDPNVYFSTGEVLAPDAERSTTELLSVTVPQAAQAGDVSVTVGNRFGGSNALTFTYAADGLIPIKFEETHLKKDGEIFEIKLITNLVYGPDHRLYLASLDSFVYSLVVSSDLTVSDVCKSNSLGYLRTVIGLAFDPAVSEPVLYASSSIFYWETSGLEGDSLWANGQISVLKPNQGGACLATVGDPIITGLPVSNHDHGVNNLLFDDDRLLHFQVGAATNAGVPSKSIGAIDESPLSAASLVANIYAPGFDGRVLYDSSDPGTANQIGGDVDVFSPGWRNSFDLTLHSNGFIYATDNGANAEFGNQSVTCTTSTMISPYYSDDKLGKVLEGRYSGHANRNRGRFDAAQCRWRHPFDDATDGYLPPIATLESSTDGIIEYTADVFSGQLKGDLLASKYSTNDANDNGRVYRVRLDEAGERRGAVEALWEASGLAITMTPWGDLLMPRLYEGSVLALRVVQVGAESGRLIAVTPFRGPARGGNEVLVTVTGGGTGAVAVFDGRECSGVRERTESSFLCVVPDGQGAASVRVGIRIGTEVVYTERGFDYRYMRV